MKLITVEATFPEAELRNAMALFESKADDVRAMSGCEHYKLYIAASASAIAIVQQWTTMEAFDAYRASPVFAALCQGLKPLMTAPPVTTVAEIDVA